MQETVVPSMRTIKSPLSGLQNLVGGLVSKATAGIPAGNAPAQPQPIQNFKPKVINPVRAVEEGNNLLDVIAPQSVEEDFDYIKINDVYFRTIFVAGYPRFVSPGWLEPVVNFDSSLSISFSIYPVDGKSVLDDLRRKIAEMEAELSTDIERGKIVDPATQAKLEDARSLQEQLVKGIERFYEFSFYITIPANSVEELNNVTRQIESQLGSLLVVAKHATLDHEEGFLSTAPFGLDKLSLTRNMDTTSVATTFPLTSTELSSDTGVLYGINSQNESFIIFDRFSLQNSNMVIFATSGAGKSLTYNEEVFYKDSLGIIRKDKIGNITNKIFKKSKVLKINEEVEGVMNPDIQIYSFNKNFKTIWSNVEVVTRKISDKIIYRIQTRSGRKIEITGDHCLVGLKDGGVKKIRGNEVQVGDMLPIARKIDINNIQDKYIDAFELLSLNKIDNLFVKDSRVGTKLDKKGLTVPKKILLDEDFYKVLGFFTAEGMISNEKALISSVVPEILDISRRHFENLGVNYHYATSDRKTVGIFVNCNPYRQLLASFGSSGKADKKRVPYLIYQASKNNIANYIKSYLEGDGTVGSHEISATTKSKMLASDLLYLFSLFGIIARVSLARKRATNAPNSRKRNYYKITISGQENIRKFIDQIGFITERKNKKSLALLKDSNTNIDVVPELQSTFRKIYKVLYNSENPAPKKFSEIKLGIFKPSRNDLLEVVSKIKNRVYEIESLKGDGLSKLNALPTITQIIDKASKNKKTNTLLWEKLNKSWSTMRSGVGPNTRNALMAAEVTHGYEVEIDEVGRSLYRTFKFTGQSLQRFDPSLWSSTLYNKANARYEKLIKARDYIKDIFEKKASQLKEVKKKIEWLEMLAKSDLFWDPIVEVKKIRSKHPYVYDLQVKDSVFLAGYGGIFVHNSFFVKLESLRSLMTGTEVIIIDPESEYKPLADAVGGEFISFSFASPSKINPFDLSQVREEGENQLGLKILSLHSLMKVIMGQITPTQEALLDRALVMTYRAKGITNDPDTQIKEPPLMEDLYKTLIGMEVPDALDLAARIEKFVRGSFVGIFDKQTNINITNPFTVFSVKDLQDTLRPIAMFIILDYIWTRVKKDLKRRLLIVDEAWHMMRYPDTAQFLWSVVKRARKYFLGLTTITQDVEDFLGQDIGKAIVTNSAMQVLLKQSPAAIDKIGEIFYLSQGEKQLLMAANVGEGIFFAGPHHAPIRVVASEEEYKLITTKPQEMSQQSNPSPYEQK